MTQKQVELFGLQIHTDWPVETTSNTGRTPDILIRRTSRLPTPSESASVYRLAPDHPYAFAAEPDGSAVVSWDDLFAFRISADGGLIEGCGAAHVAATTIETYLYSSVLSFALLRRGLEPFHATTVAVPAGAIALLAPSGTGKSTFAAALIARGAGLISDDVMVVTTETGEPFVHPGLPRLKLFPDAAALFLPGSTGIGIHDGVDKRVHRLTPAQTATAPVHLRACYLLEPGDAGSALAITPHTERDAVLALAANTFNTLDTRSQRLRQHFAACITLAAAVPVFSVRLRPGLEHGPDTADAVLHHASAVTRRSAVAASRT